MICLLGNLKGIKISDELPHQTDNSVGAYLSRINIHRKDIANLKDDKIKNEKFAACWRDTETVRITTFILNDIFPDLIKEYWFNLSFIII